MFKQQSKKIIKEKKALKKKLIKLNYKKKKRKKRKYSTFCFSLGKLFIDEKILNGKINLINNNKEN